MDLLIQYLNRIPLWVWPAILILLLLALLAWLFSRIAKNKRFREELQQNEESISSHFSPSYVKSRHNFLVTLARKEKRADILIHTGLSTIWLDEYKRRQSEKRLKLILEFIPEEGLFFVLQASLRKPRCLGLIMEAIRTHGIRCLAGSCKGEDFHGNRDILIEYMDEIRELSGDPEWNVRYFAMKVLLEDDSERSHRSLTAMMHDSHPLIRRTIILQLMAFDDWYSQLETALLHDPSFEVREAAWKRIHTDFPDGYGINYSDLNDVECAHIMDFLDPGKKEHINMAIQLLGSKNLELRHPAALFLEKQGWLQKTLSDAELSDEDDFQRRLRLLSAAVEVYVSGFLHTAVDDSGSIYLALKLLETTGDRVFISYLAERALNSPHEEQVWKQAVLILNARQSDSGIALLLKELDRRRHDEKKITFLLEHLRVHDDKRISDMLMDFLVDPDFQAQESLVKAFSALDIGAVIADLRHILQSGRKAYTHDIRITALRIIASYKLPYLMQLVLEQLPTLSIDESREFTQLLKSYGGKVFSQRVDGLLKQQDGKIRAMLIASIPLDEKKRVAGDIKAAVNDADSDVRIAAVTALAEMSEGGYMDLLRDPVARVREAAAHATGSYGAKEDLHSLHLIIRDEYEELTVKTAAVRGIAVSPHPEAVHILVDILDTLSVTDSLYREVQKGLDKGREGLKLIMEEMKEAEVSLRNKLVEACISMGEEAEQSLRELLEDEPGSLKPYIAEILEASGYVDTVIRRLSHRSSDVRRDAAKFLTLMDTTAGYRGLVQAARDPDEDVRVMVTKSLERLATKKGKKILTELQADPNRRVRRYTHWALERLAARAIDDGGQ